MAAADVNVKDTIITRTAIEQIPSRNISRTFLTFHNLI
jgi:hypothetical protein